DLAGLLTLYGHVQAGQRAPDDETNRLVSVLKLAGVVRAQEGRLRVRNRIYERVFDAARVRTNMPGAELERQRSAFRKGVARTTAVAALLLLTVGSLALLARFEANKARQVSQRLVIAQAKLQSALNNAISEARKAEIARGEEKARRQEALQAKAQIEI